jgi:lysozyme family protein
MSLFDAIIDRVLAHEGGYCNVPQDPGGETQWGICKRAYPSCDIKSLTRQQAIEIYRKDYWNAVRGDDLPPAIAFQVLDAAVNHGVGRAIMWLQDAAGTAEDGHIGPNTLAAIKAADPADLVLRFNAIRLNFYTKLGTFGTFGKGWVRRVAGNLEFAAKDN